jgi:hypothetical protein
MFWNEIFRMGATSLIKNPDFSSGSYRTRVTIAREVANILALPHPTFPLPLPHGERKGARGKVRAPGVLRSTGAATVAETPAVPANVPRTILEIHDRALSQVQVFDEALRYSPLQPMPLLRT